MPRIISFAETTAALLAGRKTVTRRDWSAAFAARLHAGDLMTAWNKNPRTRRTNPDARAVATIRLTQAPYREATAPPPTDWEAEGFAYMTEQGLTLFGGMTPRAVWGPCLKSRDSA